MFLMAFKLNTLNMFWSFFTYVFNISIYFTALSFKDD